MLTSALVPQAIRGKYSYTVALIHKDIGLFCGVLVAPDMALTAAHCADGKSNLNFDIFAGSERLSDISRSTGDVISPKAIHVSPAWKWSTLENDFALIKLDRPVSFDVKVIELNENPRKPFDGDRVVALVRPY